MGSLIDPNSFMALAATKVIVRVNLISEPGSKEAKKEPETVDIHLFAAIPPSNHLWRIDYSHSEHPMSFSDLLPLEVIHVTNHADLENTIIRWRDRVPSWLSGNQVEVCRSRESIEKKNTIGKQVPSGSFSAFCNFIRLHQRLADMYQRTTEEKESLRDVVVVTFWQRFDKFLRERTRKTSEALSHIAELAELAS